MNSEDRADLEEIGCGCLMLIGSAIVSGFLLYGAALIVHAAWTR